MKILDAKVLMENNVSSAFDLKLSGDGKYAFISFDYLDKDQGAVFQIIHTGTKLSSVFVLGDIKGAKDVEFKTYRGEKFVDRAGEIVFGFMALLYIPFLMYMSIFELFFSDHPRLSPALNWFALVFGFVGFIFLLWTIISRGKNSAKYPKDFKNMLQYNK